MNPCNSSIKSSCVWKTCWKCRNFFDAVKVTGPRLSNVMVTAMTIRRYRYLEKHPEVAVKENDRIRLIRKRQRYHDDPEIREKFLEKERERLRLYRKKLRETQESVDIVPIEAS